jgi:5'-3' exonuclease
MATKNTGPLINNWGSKEKFVIIDGHNMIFRAIFAHAAGEMLTAPTGEPTKGTYYFCRMLFSLTESITPSYIAMAMDGGRKHTWRRKLYPDYKANRDESDSSKDGGEEIWVQLRRIQQIVELLGIPVFTIKEFEADDIIATLARKGASDDVEAVIVSKDHDLHQVVGTNCRMLDPNSNEWITPREVMTCWGVPPSKVPEVKALMGDKGDNIPGIRGIGLKKASAAIQQYGTAKAVIDAVREGKIFQKQQEACLAHPVDLALQLSSVRYDVPVEMSAKKLAFNGYNMNNARPVFKELGFRMWS